jgi:hypothetical protein
MLPLAWPDVDVSVRLVLAEQSREAESDTKGPNVGTYAYDHLLQ